MPRKKPSILTIEEPKTPVTVVIRDSNLPGADGKKRQWTETPKSVAIKDDLLLTCKGTVGEMAFLKEKKFISQDRLCLSVHQEKLV